ncbi:MAG: sigma-54 dependent transcriptional regulator [Candidatus Sulfobium sp.]
MEKILIVEDERNILRFLSRLLKQEGFQAETAQNFEEALSRLTDQSFDLVLTDMRLPGRSGLDLLKWVKEKDPELPVVIITAYGSIENAVEAMKAGAANYLTKPVESNDLFAVIRHSLLNRKTRKGEKIAVGVADDQYGIIGISKPIQEILTTIRIVCDSRSNVLITGESGTGKELVARAIHNASQRGPFRFVAINCGAIPGELMENELFGHEAGSYTGASSRETGKVEMANKGTLFLDEIGEMPLPMQIKLLRFIQEREFYRIGGTFPVKADCRIIASTNRNLEEEIEAGRFREDLFYRLNVIPVQMPRLSERKEDIPLLVEHFLRKYSEQNQKFIKGIDQRALEALLSYDWPGNIRQLENIIERAIVLTRYDTIVRADLPRKILEIDGEGGERITGLADLKLPELERAAILSALESENWNQTRASTRLGITRRQLRTKMAKYNLL